LAWFHRHPVSSADLSAYVDDALPPRRLEQVRRHLASCPACTATVDELLEVKAAVRGVPAITAPRSFAVRPAMLPGRARLLAGGFPYAFAPAAALTALLLLLSADFVVFPSKGSSPTPASSPVAAKSSGLAFGNTSPADKSPGLAAESASPAARTFDSANSPPAPAPSAVARQAPQIASAPAVPAPQGLTAPATPNKAADSAAPQPQAATPAAGAPPVGQAADSAAPQLQAVTPAAAAQATAPASRPPIVPAAAPSTSSDRSVLRWLEIVSAFAFVMSLTFYFWRSRSAVS